MAKVQINDLDAAAALDGTELVELEQDGGSVQGTVANVARSLYKRYVALLTQSGTDAPVATVLENTLGGTVVWTYDSEGTYIATLAGVFTENKTWFANPATDIESANATRGNFGWIDVNSVKLSLDDELVGVAYIEIRVYP